MSRATIHLDGDAQGAVAAIDDTRAQLQGLSGASGDAERAAQGLSAAIDDQLRLQSQASTSADESATAMRVAEQASSEWAATLTSTLRDAIGHVDGTRQAIESLRDGSVDAFGDMVDHGGNARDALDGLGGAAGGAGGALSGLVGTLGALGSRIIVANQALDILAKAWGAVAASAQAYFERTEEGRAAWDALEEQGNELKGMLFELVIGTTDQAEAAEILNRVLSDAVRVARDLASVLQPVFTLLRSIAGVLTSTAIGAFDLFRAVLGQTASEMERVNRAAEGATGGVSTLEERVAEFADLTQTQQIERLTEDMIALQEAAVESSLGEWFAQIGVDPSSVAAEDIANLTELMFQNETGTRANILAVSELTGRTTEFRVQLGAAAGGLATAEEALDRYTIAGQNGAVVLERMLEHMAALDPALEENASTLEVAEVVVTSYGESVEESAKALLELEVAAQRARAAIDQLKEKQAAQALADEERAQRDAQVLGFKKVLDAEEAERAAAKTQRMADQGKLERLQIAETLAAQRAAAEEEEMLAQRRQATLQVWSQAALQLAGSYGELLAEMAMGNVKGSEATRRFFGEFLVAAGQAAQAQAAMMMFQPQFMPLAIPLSVAGGVAIGVGKALGAKSNAGTQGVQQQAAAAPTINNTTNTLVSNVGRVGSYDAYLGLLEDDMAELALRGSMAA